MKILPEIHLRTRKNHRSVLFFI